jgi:hypothetical protein
VAGISIRFGGTATSAVTADANSFENDFQRAEICERRLQQIEADKHRKPEPVGTEVVRQQQADKDERPGKPADDKLHFHNGYFCWF